MEKSIADTIFDADHAKARLEDDLWDLGVMFEETGYDYYDRSIELYDVPNDYRLPEEAQKLLFDAGFSTVYLNHNNKWETHYNFKVGEFKVVEGWRVSYPQIRGTDEGPILVEKVVETWPKKWFETGYVVVEGLQSE